MPDPDLLERAIAATEAQRALLGEEVVEAALRPLHERLNTLAKATPTGPDPGEAEQQRKQVTILFAELTNFAALSADLSDEDKRDTLDAVWRELDAAVLAHGGRIDKHIGGILMALWGADAAHENAVEQALRAALAMRAKVRQHHITLPPQHAHLQTLLADLQVRFGLNTGLVLLGTVGTTAEFTAMGDAVNLASRLENAAPVGEILISYDTYRLVRGLFDVQAQPPLKVKGKVEPIQTYLVQRAKPRAFHLPTRGVEGVETRLIGRDAELAQLKHAFYTVAHERRPQLVTVFGDEGLGKTRLLTEFMAWADTLPEESFTFQGRADETMQRLPYALWRDVFSQRFQILDSDPLAEARDKLERGITDLLPDEPRALEISHVIGHLIGLDFATSVFLRSLLSDPEQFRQHALEALTLFFNSVVHSPLAKPSDSLVLLLDDTHWADDDSLSALEHVARNVAELPLFILCLTRPSVLERLPHWENGLPNQTPLTLAPLSREHSQALVNEILQKMPAPPAALQALIVNGAEGNPFYVEELIKMLIDRRVILIEAEIWRVESRQLATAQVPSTLTGILQARLYNLDPEERGTLQRAAVIGRAFWAGAVEALDSEANDPTALLQVFGTLRSKELIFNHELSTFAGTQEYAFKHALLRDVAYETVLKRNRPVYHAQAARWLIAHSGERVNTFAALIADHYEKANDYVQAADFLLRAAKQAQALCAFGEAITGLERVLRLLDGSDAAEAGALQLAAEVQLGEVYGFKGAFPEAKRHLESAATLARARGHRVHLATALGQLGRLGLWQGEYDQAQKYMEEALPLARALEDNAAVVFLLRQLGQIALLFGDYDKARENLESSLKLANEINDKGAVGDAFNGLGNVASTIGQHAEALTHYERALTSYRANDDRYGVAMAMVNIGDMHDNQGNYLAAQQVNLEALQAAREIGSDYLMALALDHLGSATLALGDVAQARSYLDDALRLHQTAGNFREMGSILVKYARLYATVGQSALALEILGLVSAHPAAEEETHQSVAKVVDEIRGTLSPREVENLMSQGAKKDFETMVQALLADPPL